MSTTSTHTHGREASERDQGRLQYDSDGPVTLRAVPYRVYVQLRDEPRNGHLRMTYVNGTLEIMSPSSKHERPAHRLGLLVCLVAEAHGLDFECVRSTTFRRGELDKPEGVGAEPDQGFYFAHEPAIRHKEEIDLNVDPAPDLWIEVDHRSSSRARLPLYAALGVPEVWRYNVRSQAVEFLGLRDDRASYDSLNRSRSLPMLTPRHVEEAMAAQVTESQRAWMTWARAWAARLS